MGTKRLQTFIIEPLVRVGPIALNMPRASVLATMGAPVYSEPRHDCFNSALQVVYDKQDRVQMVEIARALCPVRPRLYSIPVLEVIGGEAVQRLQRLHAVVTDNPEYPDTCLFPEIEVSLWREMTPERSDRPFDSVAVARRGGFKL